MSKFGLYLSASLLTLGGLGLGSVAASAQETPARSDTAATQSEPTSRTGWNFPVYDIPADPAVRYGVLESGMKYAILKNGTPQGTVVLRFGFDVGWIDQTAEELNAAHFIEHMAFNGSTNVPEGEMLKLLERNGLQFGADTNASTGFEDTIYKLDLPRNDEALLDTGLMLMREVGSELTIAPEAVDRERGVLQSEIQTRNIFAIRRLRSYFQFIVPGSPFSENFYNPGNTATTANMSADDLRSLYERYYRPDNATLVVVGDIEPDMVEAKVKSEFSDWARPTGPIVNVDRGSIDFDREAAAEIFVDPDINYMVTIDRFSPYRDDPETVAEARRALLVAIGASVLNRRFETLATDPASPIIQAIAGASELFDLAEHSSLTIVAKEGQWAQALALGEQEYRRAMEHGFTQAEVTEQLANIDTALRNGAERQATRNSAGLAEQILGTVRGEDLFVNPQTSLAVFESLKDEMTPANAHTAFREAFGGSAPLIHVSSKQDIEGGKAAVLAAYEASRQVAVAAPVQGEAIEFAYTDFGAPGEVVGDEMVEDLGVRTIRFENGVMLNLKKTDFKDRELLWHVAVGSGQLGLGQSNPGISLMMDAMSGEAGLGKHSADELRRIFAGRNVALGLGMSDDHFHASGSTKAADFLLQMQTTAAYLTDPGYRPEAQARWEALVPPFIAQIDATPQTVAANVVPRIIANGDARFGTPEEGVLMANTLGQMREVVTPLLADSPIEITVVGDIDEAAIVDAVARTFAALPKRAGEAADFSDNARVSFAQDRTMQTLYHEGAADQGMVAVYWPTTDDDDYTEEVTGRLLGQVLQIRLLEKLREELGATYSPNAGVSMSDVYEDFGYAQVRAIVAPETQAMVFETIDEIAAELAATPVDSDMVDRARNPMLEQLARARRENGFWISSLETAQSEPDRLDRIRRAEEVLRSVTPEQMRDFASKYLQAAEALRIAIVPRNAAPAE
ncbi:MAG: peptidase M16 [Citromicrobium sp.]|nr:MAG: peptidase M16 [Citromicrobium sp.]